MPDLWGTIDEIAAETRFSGVVRVDGPDGTELLASYGYADRAYRIPVTPETRFGIASGTKGLTALTVVSLIDEGRLALATPAREILGDDLPLIGDDVTVEHLLAHRSGIGDHIDEDDDLDLDDYLLDVPVHRLATAEDHLPVLDRRPPKFSPGERFSYCNSGYVVLALLAERVTGTPFHELVDRRVCLPAGMSETAFLRSDEPDDRTARGYLRADGLRTNVLHLPVRGTGDGGLHTTVADVHALWTSFTSGRVVPQAWVEEMVRPRSDPPEHRERYGLGFWLAASGSAVILEGGDTGVSFRSVHDPEAGTTHTVVANTTTGAWPLARHLADTLGG
ncbi:serine hydrolase domain-containing protein [Nitriliruptor alkaliphilus]|uniref:serine hydrolase domain-containing protein n=1 Tax=Nitriliruptor alkaliphilus TaxID=427918 RepID=UPI0006968F09|nr:serine hydrolase domain-containing protein [Nitriliruptor alkaliphilus]